MMQVEKHAERKLAAQAVTLAQPKVSRTLSGTVVPRGYRAKSWQDRVPAGPPVTGTARPQDTGVVLVAVEPSLRAEIRSRGRAIVTARRKQARAVARQQFAEFRLLPQLGGSVLVKAGRAAS